MTSTVRSNTQAALEYALSEMGEAMTLSADTTTVGTKKAVNGATVLAPGTTIAAAKAHAILVHPQLAAGLVRD